jgi:hypothetical protein
MWMHISACGFFTAVSEDLANQLLVLTGVGKVGSAGVPCDMESECLVVLCYVHLTVPPPVIKDVADVFFSAMQPSSRTSASGACGFGLVYLVVGLSVVFLTLFMEGSARI